MNLVVLIGNLGKDPELRFTGAGKAMCTFPIATSESYTKDGERVEKTEWHNIVCWGVQAESVGQHKKKGQQVAVTGSIRTRSYDDKDGNKRYVTEINAQRVDFLSGGTKGGAESTDGAPAQGDDIPF